MRASYAKVLLGMQHMPNLMDKGVQVLLTSRSCFGENNRFGSGENNRFGSGGAQAYVQSVLSTLNVT